MDFILKVTIKHVYGTAMIYPHCDKAKAFIQALGLKTFTPAAISAAKALGYAVKPIILVEYV